MTVRVTRWSRIRTNIIMILMVVGMLNAECTMRLVLVRRQKSQCIFTSEDVKKNDHNGKMKLKELLSGPLDLNKGAFFQSKTQQFSANVINGALHDEVAMNWIYIFAAGAAVVMLVGAWQCVKEKQHSFI